ncbi:MAG TPA: DUF983 domain-containing protein [Thermoanaerobaculia bacterium]|nr:DUF983 domain-containing protein [Thermoanaerobaculia bacterium]
MSTRYAVLVERPSFRTALVRGMRGRCPRCGKAPMFQGWNHLHERCAVCGLDIEARSGDTWFFMYMSTAGLTGTIVVIMFLLRPRVLWVGQLLVMVAAVLVIGVSLPLRKGVAIALDYLITRNREEQGQAGG